MICGKKFTAKRDHAKYCSDSCRRKGMVINTTKLRERKPKLLEIRTIEEMKTIEPFKSNYNKIMMAFVDFEDKKKKFLKIEMNQLINLNLRKEIKLGKNLTN
ncbi:MAG: hypothetical protein DRN27_03260 [Thermoplasmata archaeon]|nr:MAG: hypothetical protein DRN27_03260 [Thermoplasmata archaeon]